ncbi:MAG: class I SAM-dependent methyltransferase [Pseudomonadota bacterium]|nr:class I SAM-dependent methyltransferase [Pseudomonadota bacterium]
MTSSAMHVYVPDASESEGADALARRYGFTVVAGDIPASSGYQLRYAEGRLTLAPGHSLKSSVCVDFCAGTQAHRRRFGGGLGQDIAKAVGVSGAYQPTVVDATAGLGRDAFVLATLGCRVIAIERNPVVAALLDDGLQRANQDPEIAAISQRIELIHQASIDWLSEASDDAVDVVYLDPMFEHDPKQKAAVKKDMQAFREIVGQDNDSHDLLTPARRVARCRVAVKRARKASLLDGQVASFAITGKSNRFDVYARAKVAPREAAVADGVAAGKDAATGNDAT